MHERQAFIVRLSLRIIVHFLVIVVGVFFSSWCSCWAIWLLTICSIKQCALCLTTNTRLQYEHVGGGSSFGISYYVSCEFLYDFACSICHCCRHWRFHMLYNALCHGKIPAVIQDLVLRAHCICAIDLPTNGYRRFSALITHPQPIHPFNPLINTLISLRSISKKYATHQSSTTVTAFQQI